MRLGSREGTMYAKNATNENARNEPNALQPGRGNVRAIATATEPDAGLSPPESVNWFITAWCNYACQFCFFTPRGYEGILRGSHGLSISMDEARSLLEQLAAAGTRKVTFVGGEPTLVAALPTLVRWTDELGMSPMIVTNGTGLSSQLLDQLAPHLRNPAHPGAIKLSLDSGSEMTEIELGRATSGALLSGKGNHVQLVVRRAKEIHQRGIPLMVNTVVTRRNSEEDLHLILQTLDPVVRWKVFQMLPIAGENDVAWRALLPTNEQFSAFIHRHADLHPIAEDNDAMTESYVMLDPLGRFFQNTSGTHTYSRPILKVGVMTALAEVGWDHEKFLARDGRYETPLEW